MSIEFITGTILSVIGIMASILGTMNIVTERKLKAQIINDLMRNSIRTVDDVRMDIIQARIDHFCDEHKKKPIDRVKIINGLIYEYDNLSMDDAKKIKEKLLGLIREVRTQRREGVARRQNPNTIHSHLIKFCNQLKDDTPYELHTLWKQFIEFLQESGREASPNGLRADIAYAIVNEKNRYHYQAPNPQNDTLFSSDPSAKSSLLLYYPDENNKKIVKKFNLKITDNPTIYWRGKKGEREEIKLSELRKMGH